MVQLKPLRTFGPISWIQTLGRYYSYLVQDRRYHFVKDHVLVGGWRKDFVELICLVVQRICAHGELHRRAFDAIRCDHNTAIFAHFAVVAPSTSHDDIDVCLFAFSLKFAFFSFEG